MEYEINIIKNDKILSLVTRYEITSARYGGEEFCVIIKTKDIDDSSHGEELVDIADKRMYRAKELGGNIVVTS